MTVTGIMRAIGEAERFIREAKATADWINGSKQSGACRRASMDLTRALARMRKP